MRYFVAALVVLALSAAETASSETVKPAGPPPRVKGVDAAPPPAWIEGRRRAQWLAYSSFSIWGATPSWSEVVAATAPCRALPQVVARPGDRLRFHLPFATEGVWFGERLFPARRRVATWRADGFGVRTFLTAPTAGERGPESESYSFCLVRRRLPADQARVTELRGSIVLDPATPVCSATEPCTRRLPGFLVAFSFNGVRVATVRTDAEGLYSVLLAPGVYTIGAPEQYRARKADAGLMPHAILVPAARIATRSLRYDIGIR